MKQCPIKFWEWTNTFLFISQNYPHRMKDFAKSFSENQIYAKSWLVETLQMHSISDVKDKEIYILGSWYGTLLVPLLTKKIPHIKTIHLVDYDDEALVIAKNLFPNVQTMQCDINFDLPDLIEADIIINTSCEHMLPMKDFNFNGLCIFQSNNFTPEKSHINCVDTLDEFIEQSGLTEIDFKGEIPFHRYDDEYKRFMVIGK